MGVGNTIVEIALMNDSDAPSFLYGKDRKYNKKHINPATPSASSINDNNVRNVWYK
jgi:hypothetical protein